LQQIAALINKSLLSGISHSCFTGKLEVAGGHGAQDRVFTAKKLCAAIALALLIFLRELGYDKSNCRENHSKQHRESILLHCLMESRNKRG
jgi:hypothetical protein